MIRKSLILTAAVVAAMAVPPVGVEAGTVRFGKNVRVGGHDMSNQTFTSKRRGRFYIYDRKPRNSGCRWVKHPDGSRTKVCHLQRKRH